MNITVADSVKIYCAKYGRPAAIFGQDVDERKEFTREQAIERFEKVWNDIEMKIAVAKAEPIEPERVREILTEKQREYFQYDRQYLEFYFKHKHFILKVTPKGEETEVDYLWFIPSPDPDPRTLYITFDTVDMRNQFRDLATQLGYFDGDLGKKLLLEFMEKYKS